MKAIAFILLTLIAGFAFAQGTARPLVGKPLEQDAPAFGYKGVALGASEHELLAAHPWFACEGKPDDRFCMMMPVVCESAGDRRGACMRSMTYGGFVAEEVSVRFFDDRLSWIEVSLGTRDFDHVRESLVLAFGDPTKHYARPMRRSGVELANDFYHWNRAEGQLIASRYSKDFRNAAITIVAHTAVREAERRRLEAVRRGARDF